MSAAPSVDSTSGDLAQAGPLAWPSAPVVCTPGVDLAPARAAEGTAAWAGDSEDSRSAGQASLADTQSRGSDSLAAGVIILLVLTIAQRLIGLARGMFLCRWLDPAELGLWDMSLGFLSLAAPVVVLGLPGCFGRYVEHYRQVGQLPGFLRLTTTWTIVLGASSAAAVGIWRNAFSRLIFGSSEHGMLVSVLAATLVAVIAQNYLVSLLTALRKVRMASLAQFAAGVLFAVGAIALVAAAGWGAEGVVAAYGAACAVAALLAGKALAATWRTTPAACTPLAARSLIARVMPFALWLWLTNWLANLFELADRYLLLHWGTRTPDEALAQLGQYHSSRLIPLVLVGIAELLGGLLTPYLSRDWEAGRTAAVVQRLNLALKLAALGFTAAGTAILLGAGILFEVGFQGKFTLGLNLLPWALASCTASALAVVAQNYFRCAEKARLATSALAAGVVFNVGINVVLLPSFGLWGVVLGTAAAHWVWLAVLLALAKRHGMTFHRGTLLVSLVPLLLGGGRWIALVGVLLAAALCACTSYVFDDAEKRQLRQALASIWPQGGLRRACRKTTGD